MISERSFARTFDSFWSELLPLLTPRFVSLFNEVYEKGLEDATGNRLSPLPIASGVERADIVAEFAFRLAKIAAEESLQGEMLWEEKYVSAAERCAFGLIEIYEGNKPDSEFVLSDVERNDGMLLCERYRFLYSAFPEHSGIEFCPRFPGAGFLNSCEGDVGIGSTLIEVKTTTRKPAGKDIRQLLVYLALDANAQQRRWNSVGIFNPRRGTLHYVEVNTLVSKLSGGKTPSEVYGELVGFAETNDPLIERRF